MVSPIIGPTNTTLSNYYDGAGSYYVYRKKYKQKRPFTEPAPYYYAKSYTLSAWKIGYPDYSSLARADAFRNPWEGFANAISLTANFTSERDQAINSALAKFSSKLGQTAEVAVNLAERKQAMAMMEKRAIMLYQFCKRLRRFDFRGALYALDPMPSGVVKSRYGAIESRLKRNAHRFADNFLEYHFGWEPLVKDIYSVCEFLGDPIPAFPIRARGKKILCTASKTSPADPNWKQVCKLLGYVQAQVGAELLVTNSNEYLLSRLGLTNPATIAWELIPFSFVVDWFVNVNDFLRQFTEFNGTQLLRPYHTVYASFPYGSYYEHDYGGSWRREITTSSVFTERKLGIPSVTLGIRPPWFLSKTRAFTAIALLIQNGLRR